MSSLRGCVADAQSHRRRRSGVCGYPGGSSRTLGVNAFCPITAPCQPFELGHTEEFQLLFSTQTWIIHGRGSRMVGIPPPRSHRSKYFPLNAPNIFQWSRTKGRQKETLPVVTYKSPLRCAGVHNSAAWAGADDGVDLTFGLTFQSALMPVISSPRTPPRQRRWHEMKGNKERKKGHDTMRRRRRRHLQYFARSLCKNKCGRCTVSFDERAQKKEKSHSSLENTLPPSPPLNPGLAFLAVNLFHQPSSGTSLIGNKSGQRKIKNKNKEKKEASACRKTEAATHFGQ